MLGFRDLRRLGLGKVRMGRGVIGIWRRGFTLVLCVWCDIGPLVDG